MSTPARIKPLDVSVVNKIAAGEIIIAPANALKEMMENSIDAKSSSIEVLVKEGGMKLLQITDNGSGIDKEDLPILCERFTTSKLSTFEDLSSIATYGFRGEALASISHIAHLSVTTKTESSACAWKAVYSNGELTPSKPNDTKDPKPVAGRKGTQITVEDLFYNVPSRLRALKSSSDEFGKILDVIGRYAVHTDGVGFACKRFGDAHYSLTTRPNVSIKERIRTVFGSPIANELIPIEMDPIEEYGVLKVAGQFTNPNFNNKKSIQPVFFINNRLVSNDPLKRALTSTVNHFLPKGHKSFIYLSLIISPENVDVNVHPTKREVRFLYEDEIIDRICISVQEQFSKIDSSRSFPAQSFLPTKRQRTEVEDDEEFTPPKNATPQQKVKRLDYKLVRTDANQSKITNYLSQSQQQSQSQLSLNDSHNTELDEKDDSTVNESTDLTTFQPQVTSTQIRTSQQTLKPASNLKFIPKDRVDVNLQSILELRESVEKSVNKVLTEVFANLLYIGIVDSKRRLCAIQFDVKLMLLDYASVLNELFYQIGLSDFSNFGTIVFEQELSIRDLLSMITFHENFKEGSRNIDEIIDLLINMSDMLLEYFSIEITDCDTSDPKIKSIPYLLKNYTPSIDKLPLFLYKLGAKVDWEDEKACLDGILRQLALFYIPEAFETNETLSDDDPEKPELIQKHQELNDALENVLMPVIKKKLLATKKLTKDVVEIANLPGLYRVFERC
ncbi:DNA mismatch repair protein [Wickerhamomyces ciferrii]|uniref:DNA mismatch repair protein n=1 Tax=Wickerhamomyces ciferrii (strain ATCC 14091 / BCRC 22168 / CBS 111 / JCM 3599 / NBRC 0793 / NRRL Y-1031 F-60-10) TaxID=1206466 RepID=K0KMM8_WICCF|nr:DNA mismatch repair protein [Wickerhamomyces ciferrii]CCH42624.1 DNA mismatch repair protein [Wickerhamomyces ciferrii]